MFCQQQKMMAISLKAAAQSASPYHPHIRYSTCISYFKKIYPILQGDKTFTRSYYCSYCYQLDPSLYSCSKNTNCNMRSAPRQKYYATCTVRENIMCLGKLYLYSKTCLKRPLKNRQNKDLKKTNGSLYEGRKYCRMLSWSILQYF